MNNYLEEYILSHPVLNIQNLDVSMLDEKPLKEASKNFSNSAIFEISTKSKLDSIDISKDKFDYNLS